MYIDLRLGMCSLSLYRVITRDERITGRPVLEEVSDTRCLIVNSLSLEARCCHDRRRRTKRRIELNTKVVRRPHVAQ